MRSVNFFRAKFSGMRDVRFPGQTSMLVRSLLTFADGARQFDLQSFAPPFHIDDFTINAVRTATAYGYETAAPTAQ